MTSLLDLMGVDLPVPDHTTLSRRARTREPSAERHRHRDGDGPLHVLVDSTGLKVYGAGSGWKTSTVPDRAGPGANFIWLSMPTVARSSPIG